MPPGIRKAALVAHVGSAVGWFGAVITSMAVGIVGLASADGQTVRAVYLTLEPIGWYALIPLSLASLLTGLIQSLGSTWGLLRHYWIVAKLVMNLAATGVLLLYTATLRYLAGAARAAATPAQVEQLRDPSPTVHAAAAVVLLLVALVLSVYKPRGLTAYGRRTAPARSTTTTEAPRFEVA